MRTSSYNNEPILLVKMLLFYCFYNQETLIPQHFGSHILKLRHGKADRGPDISRITNNIS